MIRTAVVVLLLLVAGVAVRGPLVVDSSAQAPDTQAALLAEVRALRVALEQLVSAGPRVQLAIGRLQLQEQKVANLTQRLAEAKERVRNATGQEAELRDRAVEAERDLSGASDPRVRQTMEQGLVNIRTELAQVLAEMQAAQTEELNIANQLAVEQGRSAEINRALDELEKSLRR